MNLLECSVKNQHLLKNFDTSEIEDGAKAYVEAGMTPQEAERKAVDDKLDELKIERSRVERDIITQYRAMRPAEVTRQPIQQSPKQTDTKPIFYSQMSRQIDKLMGKSEPVEELLLKLDGWAKSGKFKQDELNWSGLTDWLKTQDGKVTKQQVQDFIRENGVQVQEVMLGGDGEKVTDLTWTNETDDLIRAELPNGNLVTVFFSSEEPEAGATLQTMTPDAVDIGDPQNFPTVDAAKAAAADMVNEKLQNGTAKFSNWQLPGGENYRELLLTLPTTPIDEFANNKTFRSTHFDQPNILAHVRFNERTDAEGKRVLFIEEVQSDWAQKGRKEGFNEPASPEVQARIKEIKEKLAYLRMFGADDNMRRQYFTPGAEVPSYGGRDRVVAYHPDDPTGNIWSVDVQEILSDGRLGRLRNHSTNPADNMSSVLNRELQKLEAPNQRPPAAPFVSNTSAWSMLAMKRMIRYAAENGFDKIAWTTGEQQAARYDLSKQVSRITYKLVGEDNYKIHIYDKQNDVIRDIPFRLRAKELENYVGKEVASNITKNADHELRAISGDGLKVGGEGMKGFYDKILPNVVNDVLKKLGGGKVEIVDIKSLNGVPGITYTIENQRDENNSYVLIANDSNTVNKYYVDEVEGNHVWTTDKSKAWRMSREDAVTIRSLFAHDVDRQQPGFTITPKLRESALSGMPLFSPKTLANKNAAIPEETRLQEAQRIGQDKFNRFKIVHKWLGDNGLTLSEAANVYRAESLYYGRVASRVQDFRDIRVKDLIKDLEKTGHTLEEVDMALHAQHAEERNQQIAKINPQMRDGGSGMKTADAKAILAKLDPELLRVANDFRAITTDTKNILLASGLIDQDAANAWNATYKKYVPLKGGDEVVATGTGKHMDVNAKMKRAMGHSFRDEHIVENIIRDHERAITLAEKNRVGQVLLQFALEADIPDLITIGQPEKRAVLTSPQPVYEVRYSGGTIATLHNLQDARAEMQYHIQTTGMPAKNFAIHKVQGGPSVRYQANPMLAENEARVYLNGQMVRMQINDPLMARAYKNLGQDHLVGVLKVGREINTWLSKAYTGYNPAFLLKNIVRDAGEGVINLTGDYGAGTAARVVANYPGQFLDLLVYAKSNKASQLIRDYRADGGSTGASYLGDLERIGEDARAAYNDYAGVMDTARRDGVGSALHVAGDKTIRAFAHFFEILNQAGENAMRLATYKTLRETGYSRNEAALAAKDVTLNFNRKGEIGQQAGALWLFFNPAVQGSSRTLHTLLHSEHKAQAWALTGAMAVLFYAMAAWNDDMDKKRWEETPSYDKAHNLIIPLARHQIKIPIPYGYGFFGALGTAAFDVKNGKPMKDVVWHLANAFVESFSPIGNPLGDKPEYKNAADIVPFTPLKVATQIGVNRSGLGGPIYPENQRAGKPDSATMFRSTKGSVWDWAASAANRATGGDDARAGWADVHPDTIKFLWATATGGTGRFITDSGQLGNVVARGASPELHEVPIVRDFVREPRIGDTRKAFWDAVNQVEVAQGEFATAKANMEQANKGASPTARADAAKIKDQVLADTQAMRALGSALNQFKKAVDAKRDAIDAVQADKSLTLNEQRLKVKEMELEEKALYDRFLAIFKTQQARQKK